MKIERVEIKKFKAIQDFEADFNGSHVMLVGENCLGKSTIMQFIRVCIGDQTAVPPHADGSGHVIITKNGEKFTLQLEFREGKPVITVIGQSGMKDKTKGYLYSLCGAVSFNVDEFVKKSESKAGRKEQIEDFKRLMPQDIQDELRKFENNIAACYEERHQLNKDAKDLDAKIRTHRLYNMTPHLANYKKVEVEQLTTEKTTIREKLNAQYKKNKEVNEEARKQHDLLVRSNEVIFERVKKARSAAAILEEAGYNGKEVELFIRELDGHRTDIPNLKLMEELPDDSELKAIDQKIADASKVNQDYNDARALLKMMSDLETSINESGELTAKMESQKQAIADTITQMDSPVADLSYDDEGLVYRGIPVHPNSLSTSETMELGYKMKLAENKEAPLFLEGTESMGREKFDAFVKFANDNKLQIIGEKVQKDQSTLRIELFS